MDARPICKPKISGPLTLLYQVIREYWPVFQAESAAQKMPISFYKIKNKQVLM